jgi:hypothetical protein
MAHHSEESQRRWAPPTQALRGAHWDLRVDGLRISLHPCHASAILSVNKTSTLSVGEQNAYGFRAYRPAGSHP